MSPRHKTTEIMGTFSSVGLAQPRFRLPGIATSAIVGKNSSLSTVLGIAFAAQSEQADEILPPVAKTRGAQH